MIRFVSLASSSAFGSCYLIEGPDGTRVLVDYGARQRRLEADLRSLGVDPASIQAVLLTHEHSDHTYCLNLRRPLAARHGIRLLAHRLVWETCPAALNYASCAGRPWSAADCLEPGRPSQIGSLTVTPFATPHDAVAPMGFVFSCDGTSLGLATDLGHMPASVGARLAGCTHLIIESNHDREMEVNSGRPWHLIERVLGPDGHLSNDQTADALRQLVTGATKTVMLAHLSLDCNTPEAAVQTAAASLAASRHWRGQVLAAPAGSPSGWLGDG